MKIEWKKILAKTWVQILIVSVVVFLTFSNVFQNDFVGDDIDFFFKWEEIRDFDNIGKILRGNTPVGHEEVYRPVRGLIYLVEYRFFGTNEFFYHAQSILIHIFVTILIYFVIKKIVKKKEIPFFVSLLFGVHPIHTEMITFVAGSMDSFAFVFFFSSFLLYLKWRENEEVKKYLAFSLILALISFATYEVTLTLPFMIVLYELIFNVKKKWREKLKPALLYFGFFLFYFLIRFFVVEIVERNSYQAGSFFKTMLVNVLVILKYIRLNLFPVDLSLNHKITDGIYAHTFPKYNWQAISKLSIFDLNILGGLIFLLLILYWVIKNWKKQKELSLGILWFFVGFLPVLNIVPHASLLAERYSYIPSLGACIFLILTIYKVKEKKEWLGNFLLIFLVLSFSFLTYRRNLDWKNEVSLWTVDYEKTPKNSMVVYKLGSAYRDQGDFENAKLFYKKTLGLNSDFIEAYNNLGVIFESEGKWEEARETYLKALTYNTEVEQLLNNLGILERKYGNKQKAVEWYLRALEVEEENEVTKSNLTEVYLALAIEGIEEENLEKALDNFTKAFEIREDNFEIANNIGSVYARQGKYKDAVKWYKKAIKLNPEFSEAKENLEKARSRI